MPIQIRRAEYSDLHELRELCISTFCYAYEKFNTTADVEHYLLEHFSSEQLKEELSDEDSVFLVAVENEKLVGYVKIGLDPPKGIVNTIRPIEILRLYAAVDSIGKGVGRILMSRTIDLAKELKCDSIHLGVWQRNTLAIEFYKKCGYRIVGDVKFLFGSDLQDDHVMMLEIT